MIDKQTQPLELAARLLLPATMEAIRHAPYLTLRGWKILDRMAVNTSEDLRALERRGVQVLLLEVYERQERERMALANADNVDHLTEHESLSAS
jgi:hypothetical protein